MKQLEYDGSLCEDLELLQKIDASEKGYVCSPEPCSLSYIVPVALGVWGTILISSSSSNILTGKFPLLYLFGVGCGFGLLSISTHLDPLRFPRKADWNLAEEAEQQLEALKEQLEEEKVMVETADLRRGVCFVSNLDVSPAVSSLEKNDYALSREYICFLDRNEEIQVLEEKELPLQSKEDDCVYYSLSLLEKSEVEKLGKIPVQKTLRAI